MVRVNWDIVESAGSTDAFGLFGSNSLSGRKPFTAEA